MCLRIFSVAIATVILAISPVHTLQAAPAPSSDGLVSSGDACYPGLPAPDLIVAHAELYMASGQLYARYRLAVQNWAEFPDELFVASPGLPPCGSNPNSARTWVDVYDDGGLRLTGFCALTSAEGLNETWFSTAAGVPPPANVYITLHDRLCDLVYTSNLAGTAVDADGDGLLDLQDNCSLTPNADQRDTNGDNIGNVCDADLDNDCLVNFPDLGLLKSVFFTADPDADFDGNGVVNFVDLGILKARFFASPGPSGIVNACIP